MNAISFREDVLPLKDKIFRLALRITLDRQETEDIVQDILMRIWDRRESLGEVESIEALSLTMCRNLALDHIKSKEKSNIPLSDAPPTEDREMPPDMLLIRSERLEAVRKLFDSLPVPQREAIQLRDIEGKSYAEIAQITGQSEASVKVNIFRARQYIRKQIEKKENYGL